jgi:hypothetical protein
MKYKDVGVVATELSDKTKKTIEDASQTCTITRRLTGSHVIAKNGDIALSQIGLFVNNPRLDGSKDDLYTFALFSFDEQDVHHHFCNDLTKTTKLNLFYANCSSVMADSNLTDAQADAVIIKYLNRVSPHTARGSKKINKKTNNKYKNKTRKSKKRKSRRK